MINSGAPVKCPASSKISAKRSLLAQTTSGITLSFLSRDLVLAILKLVKLVFLG